MCVVVARCGDMRHSPPLLRGWRALIRRVTRPAAAAQRGEGRVFLRSLRGGRPPRLTQALNLTNRGALVVGGDLDLLQGALVGSVQLADLQHRAHATDHAPYDDGLAVQEGQVPKRDVELRAVGVLAMVRHAKQAGAVVRDLEGLVPEELSTLGRLRVQSRAILEVTRLDPCASLHSVHGMLVKGWQVQEVQEVLAQHRGVLVEQLELHELNRVFANLETQSEV